MLEARFGRFVPGFLLRRLMLVETEIERAVATFAAELPKGALVLDAGSGEGRYSQLFAGRRYVGVDLGVGDTLWDYSDTDVCGDLTALPFRDGSFEAAINIVTLEHVADPAGALREIGRTLQPGARLLIAAPQLWEVHQAPHDYFRYTRFGLERLLRDAGFDEIETQPLGGFFVLAARRLVNSLNFVQGGMRWALFPFAAALAGPLALILPSFDFLDTEKNFTLAYLCWARRA